MRSPDPIAPERLEELLAGAFPETDGEARLQGLARELRSSAPPAPAALRERVRALPPPARRRRPLLTRRRTALVFATVVLAALGASLVLGSLSIDGRSGAREVPGQAERALPYRAEAQELQGAADDTQDLSFVRGDGRARDIDMWIELRLRDADRLSSAASESMRIARELGGFVASSNVDTRGTEGRAELALRVPVARVDDAVFRLSQLGTITGQRVVTEDLQAELNRSSRRIAALRRAIRIAELRLEGGTLGAEQRLRLEIRLERLRGQLADLRRSNARLQREAATAELTLVLHTRAAAVASEDESRLASAARDALDFLARAASVALFLAIVLSPPAVLVVLAWLILRRRGRRAEAQLLERTRPGAPSPQPPAS